MGIVETIALTMGVAWASGINLYAAIAVLGLLSANGHIVLPPGLEILSRMVAVGGDTVQMVSDSLFLNGEYVPEPYAQHSRFDNSDFQPTGQGSGTASSIAINN